ALIPCVAWAQGGSRWTVDSPPEAELAAAAQAAPVAGFESAARTDDGRIQVMVELADPSAAVVFAEAMRDASPSDQGALRRAGALSQSQVARIEAAQQSVAAALADPRIGAREIYRVSKVLNGIAVAVSPRALREMQKIPGVKRLLPIEAEYP